MAHEFTNFKIVKRKLSWFGFCHRRQQFICFGNANTLKGAVSRGFSATFDIAGLKPWLSTIAHTRNAPRTSRERYQVKYWRKGELQFILGYFSSQNGKTLNFHLNLSSLELEILSLA